MQFVKTSLLLCSSLCCFLSAANAAPRNLKFVHVPYNASVPMWISSEDVEKSANRVLKESINSGLLDSAGKPIMELRRDFDPKVYGMVQTKDQYGAASYSGGNVSGYTARIGVTVHTRGNEDQSPYEWSAYHFDQRMLEPVVQPTGDKTAVVVSRTGQVPRVIPFTTQIEVKGRLPRTYWAKMWIEFHNEAEWPVEQKLENSPKKGDSQGGRNVLFLNATGYKTGTDNQQKYYTINYKKSGLELMADNKLVKLTLNSGGTILSSAPETLPVGRAFFLAAGGIQYLQTPADVEDVSNINSDEFLKSLNSHSSHLSNGDLIEVGQDGPNVEQIKNNLNSYYNGGKGVDLKGVKVKEVFQWYKRRVDDWSLNHANGAKWSGFQGRNTYFSNDYQSADSLGVFFVK